MTGRPVRGIRAVNHVLWDVWDPIGCGVPEDEYQSYAVAVYGLLVAGASRREIEDYLRWAADVRITCSVPEERLRTTLDLLFDLRLSDD